LPPQGADFDAAPGVCGIALLHDRMNVIQRAVEIEDDGFGVRHGALLIAWLGAGPWPWIRDSNPLIMYRLVQNGLFKSIDLKLQAPNRYRTWHDDRTVLLAHAQWPQNHDVPGGSRPALPDPARGHQRRRPVQAGIPGVFTQQSHAGHHRYGAVR